MKLFSELRRRNVFRMAVLYIVAAWLIMQVAGVLIDLGSVPERIGPIILPLLVIGFPIALIFSWFYEITPEGISLEKDVDAAESITHVTGRRLDFIVIALLCAGLILFAYDKWWTGPPPELSIAVLPFENMSPDPDNSYFADGISEELLNGLAKVRGLRVTARTSSFSVRDKNLDIRQIGQMLNVAFVLEGSVRVAGEKVRITAQLIDSRTDKHRWSETYDRSMSDIFDVQSDITNNITASLKTVMNIEEQLGPYRDQDIQAYIELLKGREIERNAFTLASEEIYQQAIEHYENALQLDPDYADAYSAMAMAYAGLMQHYEYSFDRDRRNHARDQSEIAIQATLRLDPESSKAYEAQGLIHFLENNLAEAEAALQQAIALNPNNARAYFHLAWTIPDDRYDDLRRAIDRAHELDPRDADIIFILAEHLVFEGKLKEASDYYRLSLELSGRERLPPKDLPQAPSNLGFESGTDAWTLQGEHSYDFASISGASAVEGLQVGHIKSLSNDPRWFRLGQAFAAGPYSGTILRLTGKVKTEDLTGEAALWVRVDNAKGPVGFDNMEFYSIEEDIDWTEYEVRSYVPSDAVAILIGAYMTGEGKMWLDDFRIITDDNPEDTR